MSEPELEPESEPASVPESGPESEPESRVGGQTNKQPTITAAAGTREYCHIEPENMHNDVVTNLGDEKLLATKLQKSKTAGTVEYCHTVPKKMQSMDKFG